jgi:hypothetical protein
MVTLLNNPSEVAAMSQVRSTIQHELRRSVELPKGHPALSIGMDDSELLHPDRPTALGEINWSSSSYIQLADRAKAEDEDDDDLSAAEDEDEHDADEELEEDDEADDEDEEDDELDDDDDLDDEDDDDLDEDDEEDDDET